MNPIRRGVMTAAIAGSLLAGGAVGATVFGAASSGAATTTGTGATTSTNASGTPATTGTPGTPHFNGPPHGTAAHEDAEKAVTGAAAEKAQAAAVKSLGGGTAGAVTTDYTGSGYETTVTKSDGTKVEVHLDSSFNVMQGPGGHGGGGPGGPPPAGAGA
jgi:nicotinic acid phosphoribosyltransferase